MDIQELANLVIGILGVSFVVITVSYLLWLRSSVSSNKHNQAQLQDAMELNRRSVALQEEANALLRAILEKVR